MKIIKGITGQIVLKWLFWTLLWAACVAWLLCPSPKLQPTPADQSLLIGTSIQTYSAELYTNSAEIWINEQNRTNQNTTIQTYSAEICTDSTDIWKDEVQGIVTNAPRNELDRERFERLIYDFGICGEIAGLTGKHQALAGNAAIAEWSKGKAAGMRQAQAMLRDVIDHGQATRASGALVISGRERGE